MAHQSEVVQRLTDEEPSLVEVPQHAYEAPAAPGGGWPTGPGTVANAEQPPAPPPQPEPTYEEMRENMRKAAEDRVKPQIRHASFAYLHCLLKRVPKADIAKLLLHAAAGKILELL